MSGILDILLRFWTFLDISLERRNYLPHDRGAQIPADPAKSMVDIFLCFPGYGYLPWTCVPRSILLSAVVVDSFALPVSASICFEETKSLRQEMVPRFPFVRLRGGFVQDRNRYIRRTLDRLQNVSSTTKLRTWTLRIWGFRGPGFRSARQMLCGDASRLFLDRFSKHLSSVLGWTALSRGPESQARKTFATRTTIWYCSNVEALTE